MKRIFIGMAAIASLLTTNAFAADLATRPAYTKAPVYIDPGFNWSGFYVGANVGYGWGRARNSDTLSVGTTGAIVASASGRNDVDGVIGGGQIGYNWLASNWLFGLETDIQGSGQRGSSSLVCLGCSDDGSNISANLTQKLNWFGTFRGRIGILATPTVLFYGTGGLAYGQVQTGGSVTGNIGLLTDTLTGTSSTRAGWTLGAGVEGQISGNWTAKLEYLYMDLGSVGTGTVGLPGILVPVRTAAAINYSSAFTDNILRVGVNYHFH